MPKRAMRGQTAKILMENQGGGMKPDFGTLMQDVVNYGAGEVALLEKKLKGLRKDPEKNAKEIKFLTLALENDKATLAAAKGSNQLFAQLASFLQKGTK